MYGHIAKLAEAEKEGLKQAGIEADVYQLASTPLFIKYRTADFSCTEWQKHSPRMY
jgi:multimeric flavodoxin WrbA